MSANGHDSWFMRAARWTEQATIEYGPTLLVAVAGLGWTFGRNWIREQPAGEGWGHFAARLGLGGLLTIAGLAGAILAYKRSGSIRTLKSDKLSLETEVNDLQNTILTLSSSAKDAWRVRLANIHMELQLDNTFRVSIYRYSAETRTFEMIGRYAPIPKYGRTGRGIYPAEIGCIGAAWESADQESIVETLPEDEDAYIKENCESWGFDENTVSNLTMKSRSVYAFTIMDALGLDRAAVVVFESTKQNAGDASLLREAVNQTYRRQLLSDLASLRFIEPSPQLAANAGF